MSDEALIKDLTEALIRLARAFDKHGMSADFAVILNDRNDADRMRTLRLGKNDRTFSSPSEFARADACCEIVGIEIRRPA